MATTLPPVSAQVELLPIGELKFTLVRTAPIGGAISSIAGYEVRLSGNSVAPFTFVLCGVGGLTEGLTISDVNVVRYIALSDLGPTFTVDTPGLAVNIRAISGDTNFFAYSPWWPADRPFPASFAVTTSSSSPLTGDVVTFALPKGYGTDNLTRIRFTPDVADEGLFTPWKSFFAGIEFDSIYRNNGTYTASLEISADIQNASSGSSFLVRSSIISVAVTKLSYSVEGINSWLGGSSFGFTDPLVANYTPGKFSVILTGAAIASSNLELKMFLATSRTADANTYYQTVAWDLYPVPGRYKIPSFAPSVNLSFDMTRAYTDASLYAPLKLTAMPLPEFQVGYFYEFELACSGGLKPYAYYAIDLPPGLVLTSQGKLTGTPQQSGLFQASVSVVDSEIPPQIDVRTMNIFVKTDLSIAPVPLQSYAIGDVVKQPITGIGGIPPYSWEVLQGADHFTSYGLSFVPGVPSAYLSGTVSDQGSERLPYTFPVTVECIDAIGSVAITTFNCEIRAPRLTITTSDLVEFFDAEYQEQRIYAIGGDNAAYYWNLDVKGIDGVRISTPIQFAITPMVGAGNTAILSYSPSSLVPTPEAFYRVTITVSSGVGEAAEIYSRDYDLIISPALTDVVIYNDSQLPLAFPGQPWQVTLLASIPDSVTVPSNRLGPITFSTDIDFPKDIHGNPYLSLDPVTGVLEVLHHLLLPANLNFWFRVNLHAGRTSYFKDFHFMSATKDGFSIHVDHSYPFADGNLVAVAQQNTATTIMNGDGCVSFKLLNSGINRWVNDVGYFSVADASSLPPGMTFSSMGFLYGIPTGDSVNPTKTEYPFTVTASVGDSTVTYAAIIIVNPPSAYASDLIHDISVSPNVPPSVVITYPPSGKLFDYGSVITLAEKATDLDSVFEGVEDPVTVAWSYGALPSVTIANNFTYHKIETKQVLGVPQETGVTTPMLIPAGTLINQDVTSFSPTLVLTNKYRVPTTYTISVTATDSMGDSGSASEPIRVDTPWFRTASLLYDTTGSVDTNESLTNGDVGVLYGDVVLFGEVQVPVADCILLPSGLYALKIDLLGSASFFVQVVPVNAKTFGFLGSGLQPFNQGDFFTR